MLSRHLQPAHEAIAHPAHGVGARAQYDSNYTSIALHLLSHAESISKCTTTQHHGAGTGMVHPEISVALVLLGKYYRLIIRYEIYLILFLDRNERSTSMGSRDSRFIPMSKKAPISPVSLLHLSSFHWYRQNPGKSSRILFLIYLNGE